MTQQQNSEERIREFKDRTIKINPNNRKETD